MHKNKKSPFFLILLMLISIPLFLAAENRINNSINVIIPKPQKTLPGKGKFLLTKQTTYLSDTSLSQNAIAYLQSHLKQNAGYLLQKGKVSKANSIRFHYDPKKIKKPESYRLHIEKNKITIKARD